MTFAVHIYLMIGLRVKYTVMLSVSETSFGMVIFCPYKNVLAKLLFFKSFASTTFVIFGCLRLGGVGGLFAVFRSGDFLRNVLHKVSNRHYYADNREHRGEPLPKYG